MSRYRYQRGYVTIAQNGPYGDYLRAAYALALSLRKTQSEVSGISVLVTPGQEIPDRYREVFDEVIEIPWGDAAAREDWKIHNKWKVFHCTPYRNTVLLDADMLFPADVSDWWSWMERQDMIACALPYTFRGDPVTSPHYRRAFQFNRLPMVYTGFMFFRESDLALRVFETAERVYKQWNRVTEMFPALPDRISGDLAFAVAIKLLAMEDEVRAYHHFPRFVHMKSGVQNTTGSLSEDWTLHLRSYLKPDGSLLVGNYLQHLPFHYHVKDFLTDEMIGILE